MTFHISALKKIPRPVLSAFVALVVGFAFGRFAAPTRVITQTHETVREVLKEDTQAREQVRLLTAQLETLKKDSHRAEVIATHKDGTKTITIVTDTHVDQQTSAQGDLSVNKEEHRFTQSDTAREVTASKTVEHSAPSWSVGAIAVLSPGQLHLSNLTGALDVGVIVERRLLGPIWLGATATVPLARPVSIPTFSLSLSVSF